LIPGRPITPSIPGVLAGGVYSTRGLGTWGSPAEGPAPFESHSLAQGRPFDPHATAGGGPDSVGAGAASVATGIRPLVPLGQFRNTFIVAMDDEGICIIDQHVAHERVLFERIVERLTRGRLESQRLLVPIVLDLPAAEREGLLTRAAALEASGFELEEFGGETTVKITAVPVVLPRDECETAVRALAQDLEGLDRGLEIQDALKRIAATMACHAAVKANDPLTFEKMRHILDELSATAYSTVCPHGRPVMLRITRREVEKNFERI
jgi:DNA mismatch repair protein MutL